MVWSKTEPMTSPAAAAEGSRIARCNDIDASAGVDPDDAVTRSLRTVAASDMAVGFVPENAAG
jgi:hypothetical protein